MILHGIAMIVYCLLAGYLTGVARLGAEGDVHHHVLLDFIILAHYAAMRRAG